MSDHHVSSAGLFRKGVVCKLERSLQVCDDFLCGIPLTCNGTALL